MAIWVWIEIAFAVVLVVAALIIVATVFGSRRKTKRLKQHYGREYERLVSETGSEKAARRELTTRESKRQKLDIVPLTPSAHSDFTARWVEVQNGFVDNPAAAVAVADRLVTEVMRQRGYPVDDFDQRAAEISVDHPQVVDNYRAANDIHTSRQDVSTEQQRKAFVHYRALFDKLLETAPDNDASREASA
jgi:hypothetical protein